MTAFAVVGHNERPLVANALRQALEAAGPGDRVFCVDSASTDGMADVAVEMGVEVVPAPLGKGRAIAAALAARGSHSLCLTDADLEYSERNMAAQLAAAEGSADMVIGDFDWPEKRFLRATTAVFHPLMEGLFPEGAGRFGSKPLSGFRLLAPGLEFDRLPPGFAAEAYMNAAAVVAGASVRVIELGPYRGPLRPKKDMGWEIGAALLDLAERSGRLDPRMRPKWDDWIAGSMEVVLTMTDDLGEGDGYLDALREAGGRPLPSRYGARTSAPSSRRR